ncbi:MAG: nicotinate-nucleotide adenylyltransferase [Chloroflexi bacterium]|nr:MAG: nicotinate-nucleotide adenylyltransferase [Chloroflexota bacterium]
MGVRIGVFGGTFDPPHIGHLVAAEEARVQLGLAQVVFVPAGTPPHKLGEPVSPVTHRVEMITRAVASNPHFLVSLVDVERPGPSFTVDMLRTLRDQWPADTEIYFIMGEDSLEDLPTWHAPEQLLELCRLAVVNRPGYEAHMDELEVIIPGLSQKVDTVAMPLLDVSSTDLRGRVRQGRPLRYYVPAEVEAYIRAHDLYA